MCNVKNVKLPDNMTELNQTCTNTQNNQVGLIIHWYKTSLI